MAYAALTNGLALAFAASPGSLDLRDLAVQADGKVVALGSLATCRPDGTRDNGAYSMALVRFTSAGHLDAGFGSGGVVPLTKPNSVSKDVMLLRDDGSLWVAGTGSDATGTYVAIAGLGASGAPTAALPERPFYRLDAADQNYPQITKLLAQANGKALAYITVGQSRALVARLTADGTLDPTFATGGVLTTLAEVAGNFVLQQGGAALADGKFLSTALDYKKDGTSYKLWTAFYRYDEAGKPDLAFGDHGGLLSSGSDLLPLDGLPDERLLTVERTAAGSTLLFLAADGRPDTAIGKLGHVALPNPDRANLTSSVTRALAQTDGKLVLWASDQLKDSSNGFKEIPYLIRMLPDGTLDRTFAHVGMAARDLMPNRAERPMALALDGDGRIVAASTPTNNSCNPRHPFLITRTLPDGGLDPAFGDKGVAAP